MGMITDADTNKLLQAFKKVFPTKEYLDNALKDQTETIVSDVGEYIADTIAPMFNERDRKIARLEKNAGLPPLAD